MRASLSLILFVGTLLVGQVFSQELPADACERLTEGDLGNRTLSKTGLVPAAIVADGDGSAVVSARLIPGSINIVCEAQHEIRDRYRYTSVLFSYVCSSVAVECDDSTVITDQLTLSCVNRAWSLSVVNTDASPLTSDPLATASTALASACSLCIPPTATTIVIGFNLVVSNVTHCVECENCTVGLGRCFGSDFNIQTCCNYFSEGRCVENCPTGQVPGPNFVCGCSTLNDPNGQFSYSNDTDIDSMATLACNTGYVDNNSPATCTQSGDWTTTPNCTPLCMVLPLLVNGTIRYTNLPNKLIAGTEASYECNQGFLIDPENGLTRTCLIDGTWSGMSSTCKSCSEVVTNCKDCKYENGVQVCTDCQDGYVLDDFECKTNNPDPVARSSCDVPCIIGIVLAILAVIVITTVVIVVAFVLYKYLNDPATKLAKTDAEGLNGVARDNPLYVDPAAVTDDAIDGATETTPLDS